MQYWRPLRSGQHGHESFVENAVVVKDRLAQLVGGPGHRFVVRVVVISPAEHFVAVTGRVEEVDGLAVSEAVAGWADGKIWLAGPEFPCQPLSVPVSLKIALRGSKGFSVRYIPGLLSTT
ncbi:hypothetical protein, partial [Acinetobacter baumannii]|uniref:hypothetical protein n=1 Tax=Acinetobacter baumannii TaxID=470 RepID=UPI003D9C7422